MTTANVPATHDTYAPLWERLRGWRDLALKAASDAPAQLSRREVEPMLRWIFVLEFILRRLVLIAATALVVILPQPATRPKSASAATRTSSGRAATTARPNTFRLHAHNQQPRDQASHAAHTTAHHETTLTSDATQKPPHKPRYPLPIDTLLRASHDNLHDAPERPERPERPEQPEQQAVQLRAPKRTATYAATPLIARITHLAQLIANPDTLIARAARALARNRETATRLAWQRPPRARGVLRTMPRIIAEILVPLHDALSDILLNYAHANTS